MKKLISNLAIALSVVTLFSCDFVQDANPPAEPSTTGGAATNQYVSDSTINSNPALRKVLVEDYTGHKCGNCPRAAEELVSLESQYPGKIVPLAIHAGFFATVNAAYPTDFRTTTGDTYDTQFGISSAGNPNGLINRVGYGTGGFIKAYTSWGGEISTNLAQSPKFQVTIKYKYETGTLKMNTDVKVKSLSSNTGIYKTVVLLTEDSIIAEQLDYNVAVPPATSQKIPDYQFDHLLRGTINSAWGDAVFTGGAVVIFNLTPPTN